MVRLSVVIPVYNEAGCLAEHTGTLSEILTSIAGEDWEILLVDDGSSDGTRDVIQQLVAEGRVRGCYHEVNRGKGAAVRTGMIATRGEVCVFCDADMSTPPETLRDFVARIEAGADVVVGNRKSQAATIDRYQPRLRTWLGLGYTKLANAMLGLSVSDYTCGFKAFAGDPARKIFQATETSRWSFDAEVLAHAVREGLTIEEVPVRWHHEDDTRVRVARDVIASFMELLSIRRRLGRIRSESP